MADEQCPHRADPNLTESMSSALEAPSTFDTFKDDLSNDVPKKLETDVPSTPSKHHVDSVISKYNDKSAEILKSARLAAIRSYVKSEDERINRQKPLLYIVAAFTAFQLIAFNIVIIGVAYLSFKSNNAETIGLLFDILKYYIGATIVELIGMLTYITSSTFSTLHKKTMELLLKSGIEPECNNHDTLSDSEK